MPFKGFGCNQDCWSCLRTRVIHSTQHTYFFNILDPQFSWKSSSQDRPQKFKLNNAHFSPRFCQFTIYNPIEFRKRVGTNNDNIIPLTTSVYFGQHIFIQNKNCVDGMAGKPPQAFGNNLLSRITPHFITRHRKNRIGDKQSINHTQWLSQ